MDRAELSDLFIKIRKENGIKLADLASTMGYTSYVTLTKREHSKNNYSLNFACQYLHLLGCYALKLNRYGMITYIKSQTDFADLIKAEMKARGEKMSSMANILNTAASTLCDLLNNKKDISVDKFFHFVDVLGFQVTIQQLDNFNFDTDEISNQTVL